MKKLTITVSKTTADTLNKIALETKIPVGAVVDRLVVNAAPDDPLIAFTLALQQYFICISGLDDTCVTDVFGNMCALFLSSIPPEELDYFISELKSTDFWDEDEPAPVPWHATEYQLNELRLAVNEAFHHMRNVDTWRILYDFIYRK